MSLMKKKKALNGGIALNEIAAATGATVIGAGTVRIMGLCSLDEVLADHLTFSTTTSSSRLEKILAENSAAAMVVDKKIATEVQADIPLLSSEQPLMTVVKSVPLFYEADNPGFSTGISSQASIDSSAIIGEGVSIGPFAFVGPEAVIEDNVCIHPHVCIYPRARIGAGSVLHSSAVVREGCQVGAHAVIQNGAIIGADGFGYLPDPQIGIRHVPQVGVTVLEDRVEVGANSCVDRATLGTTTVMQGAKLDNLVQIGHNTRIGQHSIICGQAGIAGSCSIGNQTTLGGFVGMADHMKVGDNIRVAGRSGIVNDLLEEGDYGGFPAVKAGDWRRQLSAIASLPKTLREIRKTLKNIE